MTSAAFINHIKILIDKYGSPYFEDNEILGFGNIASLEVLNRMIPDSLGGVVNYELDAHTLENVAPLLTTVAVPTSYEADNSATLDRASINAALSAVFGQTSTLFRILNMGVKTSTTSYEYQPIKFVKTNNIHTYSQNTFKKPSVTNYIYSYQHTTQFRVAPFVATIYVTALKYPKVMEVGNSPDWGDYVMNQVIFQTLKLAGVPLRDEELIADVRNTGIQSAQ